MKINCLKHVACIILFVPTALWAQDSTVAVQKQAPRIYLGGGIGFNDYGIGFGAEFPIMGKMLGYFDVGTGGWGGKVGAGGTYYFDSFTKGSSLSGGISRASGANNVESEMTVEPNGSKKNVVINFNPMYTLNIKYAYSFPLGKSQRNKFQLSVGYSVPLTSNNYEIETPNTTLDNTSESSIRIMEPGGLIVGGKFMFGIGH